MSGIDREPEIELDAEPTAIGTEVHESRSRVVRALLVFAGSVCVVLGVIGIVLPVVPTTPFLLLAAVCYARGSKRFYRSLLANRYFGSYIRDWREKKGLTLATKVWIVFVLVGTIALSAWYFVPMLPVKILLGAIGTGVSIYIFRLPTKQPE